MDISILIIEDEVGISNIERKYLEKEGYLVDQSFNGEDALIKIKENRYDLILLDLMLPGVSGEEIMEYIRTNSETPVIMVTAKVEEEQIVKGLKIGADDYISKPFSPKEMVQRVKTVLRRQWKNSNRF